MQENKQIPKSKIWNDPELIIVSDKDLPLEIEIIERLKRRNIKKIKCFTSLTTGLEYAANKVNALTMIFESTKTSLHEAIATISTKPSHLLTPYIFAFRPTKTKDVEYFKDLKIASILPMPFTPGAFIAQTELVMRQWSLPNFTKLLIAKLHLLKKNPKEALKLILSLASDADTQSLTIPLLTTLLEEQQEPKTIEKIILSGLKSNPRNVLLIVNTANFYLRVAMPETALKVIEASKRNHNNQQLTLPVELQAHIMLNDLTNAYRCLQSLEEAQYLPSFTRKLKLKILFAEGQQNKFQKLRQSTDPDWKSLQQHWEKNKLVKSA